MGDDSAASGKVEAILSRYSGNRSDLIMVLQDLQRDFGYLPKDALETVSSGLGVPLSEIHHVATFYKAFSLIPKGRKVLRVCQGTACHIRGAKMVVDEVERQLKIKPGETTPDREYSLETVNCVGACAMAPVVIVNKTYHGKVQAARLDKILSRASQGGPDSAV